MEELKSFFENKGDTLYLVRDMEAVEFLNSSIESDFISSLALISDKGLFDTLVSACTKFSLGFDITGDAELEDEEFLHAPSKYKAVISVDEDQEDDFVDYMFNHGIEVALLGHTTKGELRMDDKSFGYIEDYLK